MAHLANQVTHNPSPRRRSFPPVKGNHNQWLLARPASGSHSQALAPLLSGHLRAIGDPIRQHRQQASLAAGKCNRLGE